jgi:hypothetical protein
MVGTNMAGQMRGSRKKFRSETGPLQRYKHMRKSLIYIDHARVQSSLTAPSEPLDNKKDHYATGALCLFGDTKRCILAGRFRYFTERDGRFF